MENNSMNNKMRYGKTNLLFIALVFIGLVVIFSCGISNVSAAGNTVYVNASGGNDSWDGLSATHSGTLSGPKLSIKNATGTIDADGTVNIADGQYTGENNTEITINKNMYIQGQSETGTIINGTGTNWIFQINPGITLNILNLTLTNGTATNGSAIYNDGGTVNVTGINFTDNSANNYGGAIYNNGGTVNVTGSIFTGNTNPNRGGAIYNSGILNVTSSTFTGNSANNYGGADGGAICNSGGDLNVTDSNFTVNTANSGGGAISNSGGDLNVTGSTFTGNSASGVWRSFLRFWWCYLQ